MAESMSMNGPSRAGVPAIDEILGVKIAVLDDGFVRVVDYMGSDSAVVQAARVSYGAGTKQVHEDRGLIRYLMRHHHTTPFEMCEIKLHVRVPMDCWRQWIRHRTANVNEYSTRYSVAIDASQTTSPAGWRQQSMENRQGGSECLPLDVGSVLSSREEELHTLSRSVYKQRLDAGVAREQARKDLPLSTYTEAYWKIDLHNLLNFLSLRMDDHAQHEIRSYANAIGFQIVSKWCPDVWQAFVDYRIGSLVLSFIEIGIIKALVTADVSLALRLASEAGWLPSEKRNRERDEAATKLRRMGLQPPW